jgi:predicted  nucleic acid-binding Zn-ribbon protein
MVDKSDLILSAIERMYADIVEIKADVSVLKADVSVLKSDMVEVKSDIGGLKGDVAGIKGDIAGLKGRMDDLEAGQRTMRQVIGGNHLKVMGRIDQLSDQLGRHIKHAV